MLWTVYSTIPEGNSLHSAIYSRIGKDPDIVDGIRVLILDGILLTMMDLVMKPGEIVLSL